MKIKHLTEIVIAIILILGIYYWLFPLKHNMANPMEYFKIKELPKFSFYQIENDTIPFTPSDLELDKPLVLIHFNTHCPFCQNELGNLSLRIDEFKNVQFLLVSMQSVYSTKAYMQELGLYGRQNIHLARDKKQKMDFYFGHTPIPTTFIYDANFILKKRFIGEQTPDVILETLKN